MEDHHDHQDHHHCDSVDDTISGEKWAAMGVLTLLSVTFGLFPYILFTYYRRVIRSDFPTCKIVLAALSSVSGGFLLATTMLHILPEVRDKALNKNSSLLLGKLGLSSLPPAEMLMLFGFCLIYGLEEIGQFIVRFKCNYTRNRRKSKNHHHHHIVHSHQELGIGNKLDLNCSDDNKYHPVSNDVGIAECQLTELITPDCKPQIEHKLSRDSPISTMTLSHSDTDNDSNQVSSSVSCPTHLRGSVMTLNHLDKEMATPLGALRSLVSLLALSFHAIMEGIAVGVQQPSDLWMTFGAIASHKCIIALCLGMEMMKSNMNWKTLVASIITFSIVSPIGILIGSLLVSGDFARFGWIVVVEGLAAGTLLYVIFFEILPPSHDHDHSSSGHSDSLDGDNYSAKHHGKSSILTFQGLLRFFGTFLGIIIAAYLLNLASHGHNHTPCQLKDAHLNFNHTTGHDSNHTDGAHHHDSKEHNVHVH